MKTLKISKLFRPLRWTSQFVPFIRISGNWLAEAGFKPETHVIVTVVCGSLVITPATPEDLR